MNKQIIDEAAEWFVEINEDTPERATRQRFHAWLTRSPEHVHAYLRMLPIWREGERLDTYPNDPEALIAWAETQSTVVPLAVPALGATETSTHNTKPWPGVLLALAASVAVAAATLYVAFLMTSGVYKTGVGEHVVITLKDRSTVTLNSRSKMKVRFSEQERSIELLEGQALFTVAREAARPFVVRSGEMSVLAVGTQFDVYRKKTGTVVTVIEGKVAIHSPQAAVGRETDVPLVAGEQVVVGPSIAPQPKPADVALATAWTQQQLVFFRAPLAEVVEEFNRYNRRQLIVRDEPRLKARRISGTFSSTDPASLIRFLQAQQGIRVEESRSSVEVFGEP
jgi:transmembrane sensor